MIMIAAGVAASQTAEILKNLCTDRLEQPKA